MSVEIPASISLADFSHMLVVNYNAIGPADAATATLAELAALRSSSGWVVVCLDSKPYWRSAQYPDYKKGRKVEPDLINIWERTVQRVKDEGYNIARAPHEEADDVIATLARIYSEEFGCTDVRLVTADKDVLQLVNERIRRFSPVVGKRGEFDIAGPEYVKTEYGVAPADFALLLAMMGDTSDHIPGIKQIGKGIGAKLITQYGKPGDHMASMAAIADACSRAVEASAIDGKLPAFWKNYAAGMHELPKWLKLTTARTDVALELHPLKYLERIEPVQLVPEEDADAAERLALEGELEDQESSAEGTEEITEEQEIEWDRIAKETAERERAELAAALPVTPAAKTAPAAKPAPIIGKDPNASAVLQKAAEERAALSAAKAPAAAAAASPAGTSAPSPTAATTPDTAQKPSVSAQIVPPTQGPPKPRVDSDGFSEPPIAAITPYAAPCWELATQPASAGHAFAIAKRLWGSRLYENKFKSHEQLAAVILRGRELGLGMTTALEAFHMIRGVPHAAAQLISGLAEQDPNHDYAMLVELTETKCVVEIKHKRQPKPVPWEYTIDEADRLGLLAPSRQTGGPSQWVLRPKTMLMKTCRVIGHRFMFPGKTLGLHALETNVEGLDLLKEEGTGA